MSDIGLKWSEESTIFVIARCPELGEIMLGGLGALGVGKMVTTEQEYHKDFAGYDEAPVMKP